MDSREIKPYPRRIFWCISSDEVYFIQLMLHVARARITYPYVVTNCGEGYEVQNCRICTYMSYSSHPMKLIRDDIMWYKSVYLLRVQDA